MAKLLSGEQFERGLGGIVRIALRLARLDRFEDARECRVALFRLDPHGRETADQVRLPGLVRHRHDAGVADRLGRDVFVGGGILLDRACMEARLVCEGRGADIGRAAKRHAVQDVVELAGDAGEGFEALGRDAGGKAAGIGFFQKKRRDQRCKVGVAAAFAEAVQRALDLARARFDRREAARHGVAGIVVGVDAEAVARNARGDDSGGDLSDLGGERAAVGVAEDDPAGAGLQCGLQAVEGVRCVGLVAIEEMFGVEQRLPALANSVFDAGADAFEVVFEADAEGG